MHGLRTLIVSTAVAALAAALSPTPGNRDVVQVTMRPEAQTVVTTSLPPLALPSPVSVAVQPSPAAKSKVSAKPKPRLVKPRPKRTTKPKRAIRKAVRKTVRKPTRRLTARHPVRRRPVVRKHYGSARTAARAVFGSQYGCAARLIARESAWNVRARNRSSGAYGLPQALPGSKMASAGSDWRTNPRTQLVWMRSYTNSRYGGVCRALAHSHRRGWY